MDYNTLGPLVLNYLPKFDQPYVHRVDDAV